MTNQTIPPCPVCGKLPIIFGLVCTPKCDHIMGDRSIFDWRTDCSAILASACRELGIETVEQLKAKVQPDPRVAVDLGAGYFDGGMALIDGDCPKCGMSSMLAAYFDPERHRCAAQRGEVEK